jgi:hypothetical protein
MVVRTQNERGAFAAIFGAEQEEEATRLYERLAKDACGKAALIQLLDNQLNSLKAKIIYNSTDEASL